MKKNNKGFSLVELIVVIAIMAILAAVAIPTFAHFITKAHESSDAELLHNINYIFNAACLENGIDVKDVTSATWSMDDMLVTSVNGDARHPVVASFATHFGEMVEEEFYYIENLAFDPEKHEFVDAANVNNVYADIFNSIENIDDLVALINGSTFGQIGAQGLLNRVNDVTNLAEDLFNMNTNGSQKLKEALSADVEDIARSMGMTVAQFEAHVEAQENPDEYYNNLLANYAVLQVANTTANKDATVLLADLQTGMSTSDISNMIGSGESETSKNGVAKAAMMYAMYTAYANQLPEGDAKDAALANLTDMDTFVVAIADETQPNTGFMKYLAGEQAVADMNGFVASMNVISSGAKQDSDATRDLLENGYDNDELIDSLQGVIGK